LPSVDCWETAPRLRQILSSPEATTATLQCLYSFGRSSEGNALAAGLLSSANDRADDIEATMRSACQADPASSALRYKDCWPA